MRRINILTTHQLKSKLYLFPLHLHARKLREADISFKLFYRIRSELFDADQIVIDQHFSSQLWKDRQEDRHKFLGEAKEKSQRLLWFDTTASTSIQQPDVLPYVTGYYKALVLRDLSLYSRPLYSNRVFSDYYHRKFSITDEEPAASPYLKSAQDLDKIKLFWNYSLAGFAGIQTRIYNRLRTFLPFPYFYSLNFTPPQTARPTDISCRLAVAYERNTISHQRRKLKHLLEEKYKLDVSRISQREYLRELRRAKISLSPFGWGEINYRDFEIIPSGSALMKPDMEHLRTWPFLYRKDETYISHDWDLSNVEEKIDYYLQNNRYAEVAHRSQSLYRTYLFSKEGHEEFLKRVMSIFNSNED